MRVYVGTTADRLRAARDAGALEPGDDVVVAESDAEEDEYAALMTAADVSVELLRAEGGTGRRLVVAAETSDPTVTLSRRSWAAIHADPEPRDFAAPDADVDDDLAWYGVQELDGLL